MSKELMFRFRGEFLNDKEAKDFMSFLDNVIKEAKDKNIFCRLIKEKHYDINEVHYYYDN